MIFCPQCGQTTQTCNDCGGALIVKGKASERADGLMREMRLQLEQAEADVKAEKALRLKLEKEVEQLTADLATLLEDEPKKTQPAKTAAKKTTKKGK